jgi:hypothetical protein
MHPTLYILQREPGFLSEKPGNILGVFSNADKATTEAQNRAGFKPKYPGYHGLNEYRVTDLSGGNIRIVQKDVQGEDTSVESGMNGTVYLALEQSSNYMLEIEAFADKEKAWEACLRFQKKRGGGIIRLKDEKKWVDKNGLRHVKARYEGVPDALNDWHHWYVGAFKMDEAI